MNKILGILIFLSMFTVACTSMRNKSAVKKNSPYTHGNVQLTIKKGQTTQTEIIEKFGSPNIATINSSGNEVWTYQKHAVLSESKNNSNYATILILGRTSTNTGFEQTSKTMTLIIYFDKDKKVSDFRSMYSEF